MFRIHFCHAVLGSCCWTSMKTEICSCHGRKPDAVIQYSESLMFLWILLVSNFQETFLKLLQTAPASMDIEYYLSDASYLLSVLADFS